MDAHNTNYPQGYDSLDNSSLESTEAPNQPLEGRRPDRFTMRFNRSAAVITVVALAVIVLIGGASAGLVALLSSGKGPSQNGAKSTDSFSVGNLPVQKLKPFSQLQVGEAEQLDINGQLEVNNTVVISPTSTPSSPVIGQIYFDKSTNQPYYYNGSQFVNLNPNGLQHVTSIGGASGDLALGTGLQVSGNQLSIAASLLQSGSGSGGSGVVSLQGLTGAVTLHAGGGIAISGTTITNSGVSSLLGTANEVNVSANSGGITVSLPQAIDTAANVQFNSLVLGGGDLSLVAAATVHTNNITTVGTGDTITITGDGNIVFQNSGGANSFTFPTSGGTGQVICTTAITCASGGGQAVLLEPTGAQTASANKTAVFLNKTGGTGNLIQLQDAGTDALVIDNAGNTTIGKLAVSNGLTVGNPGSVTGSLVLANSANARTITLQPAAQSAGSATVTIPDLGGVNDTVCLLTLANCVGAGGSVSTTGGTQNFVTKYNNAGATQLTNSQIYDNGTGVAIDSTSPAGLFNVGAGNQFQVSSSGVITAPISGNTINGLVVNSGALSSITTIATSGTINTATISGGNLSATAVDGLGVSGTSITGSAALNIASTGANAITLDTGGASTVNVGNTNATTVQVGHLTGTIPTVTVQGSSVSLVSGNGTNTTTVGFSGTQSSGNITYNFDRTVTAGTYTICTTIGNCAGAGGGITGSGTSGNLAEFSGSGTITNAPLTDSGGNLTASGNLTIQGGGGLTVGVASTTDGSVAFQDANGTHSVTLEAPAIDPAANLTFRLPNSYGSSGYCLQSDGLGGLSFQPCTGGGAGGVTSLDNQTGVVTLSNSSGVSGTITINNAKADGSTKGIATFNSTNFSDNGSGVVNTIQDIASSASPSFAGLTTSGNINTTAGAFQLNGTSINTAGTLTNVAYLNQANTFTAAGTALSVTNSAAIGNTLTVGIAGTTTGSLKLANSGNANTVTLQSTTQTLGSSTITIPNTAGVNDTVCLLTLANCVGTGGGIAGSGTSGTIAVFTGTNAIGNSLLSETATTLTAAAAAVFKNASNSTTAFQVQDSSSNPIFDVDTANGRVGINTVPSSSALQVQGTTALGFTNSQGALGVYNGGGSALFSVDTVNNNVAVMTPQNASAGTTTVNSAGLVLESQFWNGSSSVASNFTLKNLASTSAPNESLAIQNNANATIASFGGTGAALFQNSSNSSLAFQVQNAAGNPDFTVDTSNNQVVLGHVGSANGLQGILVLADGSTDNFGATIQTTGSLSGNSTFQLGVAGANGTYQICTTLSVCSGYAPTSGSGSYVQLAPASAQGDASTNSSIFINKTGVSGNLLELQKSGADVFTVGNSGVLTLQGNQTNDITVAAQGSSNTAGNNLTLGSSAGNGTGNGGTLALQAAASGNGATGNGGNVNITAGGAASTNGNGGNIVLTPGNGTGTGTSGSISIPFVGTGNTAVFSVANSTGTFFSIDNNGSHAQVGGSTCTGTIGSGRLCANSSTVSPSTTNVVTQNTTSKVSGTSTGTTNIYNSLGYLTDTSTGGTNVLNGYYLDASNTTNASTTVNALTAKVTASQLGSFLQFQNGANTVLNVANSGATTFKNSANSSTAFQIQNTSNVNLLAVDTSGSTVNVGVTGATAQAGTVNLATSTGAAQTVTLGSTASTSATTIQGGTGNIAINTGAGSGTTGSISVLTGNSSTATSGNITIDNGTSVLSGVSILNDTFEGVSGSADDMSAWFGDTVAPSNTQAHGGSWSLGINETASCWGVIENFNAFNVTAGHQYMFTAWFRGNTSGESIDGTVNWDAGSNLDLGHITDTTTGWTEMTATGVAPAGAAHAYISFESCGGANGHIQYLDDVTATDLSTTTTPYISIGATNTEVLTLGNLNQVGATSLLGGGGGINLLASANANINIGTNSSSIVNVGAVGSTVANSIVNVATSSDSSSTQTVTIGSAANTANSLTLKASGASETISNSSFNIQATNQNNGNAFLVQGNGTVAGSGAVGAFFANTSSNVSALAAISLNTQAATTNALAVQSYDGVSTFTNMFTVGATGKVLAKNLSDSTTAFQIQNSSGTNLLSADTTTNTLNSLNLTVGSAANLGSSSRSFSDGFESGNFNLWDKGVAIAGTSTVASSTTPVHSGKYAAKFTVNSGGAADIQTTVASSSTVMLREYVNVASQTVGNLDFMNIGTQTYAFTMYRDSATGKLSFFNGNTSAATVGSTVLTTGSWHEIEEDLTINSSTGTVTVYLDGVSVISLTNQNTGSTNPTLVGVGDFNNNHTGVYSADDVAVDTVRPGESANVNVGDSLHVSGTTSLGNAVLINDTDTSAFQVQNASGVNLLGVDTTNSILTVATAANGGSLVNNGSTLNTAKSLGNFGSSGSIGTAATTVDKYTTFVIPQTTSSISLTVPNPTDTTAGRIIYIANTGSATLTVAGITLTAGSNMSLLWNGSAWTSTAVSTGVTIVGAFSGSSQTNGASISGNTITFGPADATNPGMVSTGTQTFAGSKTFKTTSNSTTAFQIQNSSAAALLTGDTTNMRLGVDVTYAQMSAPSGTPSVTAAGSGSGSLTNGATYRYKVTAIDAAGGETTASTEGSGTATATKILNVSWTAVTGAAGYKVYRTAANGATNTEVFLTSVLTNSFSDSGTTTAGTASVPGSNTAYTSTNVSGTNNTLQVSVGGLGSPTGQLYVSGSVPTATLGVVIGSATPTDVYVQGTYAYAVTAGGKLEIYDISSPASPTLISNTTEGTDLNQVVVQGRYAYLTDEAGNLVIVDVSNPNTPTALSTFGLGASTSPTNLAVQGRYVYVSEPALGNIDVVDVVNPSAPRLVANPSMLIRPGAVYVQGRYLYVLSTTTNEFFVYDIETPSGAAQVADITIGASGNETGLYVQGRYAYVTSSTNTMHIIDIGNPTTPVDISNVATGTAPTGVYVQGKYAYVTNGTSNTVQTIDVTNPAVPVSVGTVSTGSSTDPTSVYVQGRYAYVTTNTNAALQAYDIGGAYVQQLETGGLETGTLQANGDAAVNGELALQGSLTVGTDANVNGDLAVGGSITGNSYIGGGYYTSGTLTDSGTTSHAVATGAFAYYLNTSSGTTNTTFNSTFSLTGLPNVNGTVAVFTVVATKGTTGGSQTHSTVLQINAQTVATVSTATGTGSSTNSRSFTVAYINGTWTVVGEPPTTVTNASSTSTTADYAEWIDYSGNAQPQPGDVLSVSSSGKAVTDSMTPYDNHIIGVVSTTPYEVGGQDDGHSVILALTGRVPVKVSLENGPIQPGDPLTSSSTPGVAMKASKPGNIIGTALDGYDGTQADATVTVQLHPGYDDPSNGQNSTQLQGDTTISGALNVSGNATIGGDLNVTGTTTTQNLTVTGTATLSNLTVSGAISTQSLTVTGAATVGSLSVTGDASVGGSLTVSGHFITSGNQPTAAINSLAGSTATCTVTGNDTSGSITVVALGMGQGAGLQCTITFSKDFSSAPHPVLTPTNGSSVMAGAYVTATTKSMTLNFANAPAAGQSYNFNYFSPQ